jgi:hypothetical protein
MPDHAGVVAVNVLCAVAVLACWVGAAVHETWHPQLKWVEGAIVAAVVASVADGLWLLQGMRQLRARRREVVVLGALWARPPAPPSTGDPTTYVAAPRMTVYHDPGCLMSARKANLSAATAEEHARAGRTPCRMCLS